MLHGLGSARCVHSFESRVFYDPHRVKSGGVFLRRRNFARVSKFASTLSTKLYLEQKLSKGANVKHCVVYNASASNMFPVSNFTGSLRAFERTLLKQTYWGIHKS
jgi:hypothetical protein